MAGNRHILPHWLRRACERVVAVRLLERFGAVYSAMAHRRLRNCKRMLLGISIRAGKGPRLVAKSALLVAPAGAGFDCRFGDDIYCWGADGCFRSSPSGRFSNADLADRQPGNEPRRDCAAACQRRCEDRYADAS